MPIDEIRSDGFEISDEIYMALEGHTHWSMVKSLGIFLSSLADVIARIKPDWLILSGDRGEQLMGAICGAYAYVPTAHIQAGELSGNIDGMARHALGKFAHLHFASNQDAADRLLRLGEESFRIKMVGAPQLDELTQGLYTPREELVVKYELDLDSPFILAAQHAVTAEYEQAEHQIEATMAALNHFDMTKIWVFPNNDAGSHLVRQGILRYKRGKTYVHANLKREDYLGFLKETACLVGNSSSGILEAPTFKVPAVNLGTRQQGRIQGKNVINAPFETDHIIKAIETACSPDFRRSIIDCENPYGDGHSSERILDILEHIPRDAALLTKHLTY
jgi:UDP-hydrolysing UDP-N-acetyl-D-glucosamine 2-epimerase